jgi:hypothetical protein
MFFESSDVHDNLVQNNIKARNPYLYIKGMKIRVSYFN